MDMSSRAPVPVGASLAAGAGLYPAVGGGHAGHISGGPVTHAGNPWFLALTALGVVFGDIGTSPLYAFQVALTGIGHPVADRRPTSSASSRSSSGR